jgi:hypothetical protein
MLLGLKYNNWGFGKQGMYKMYTAFHVSRLRWFFARLLSLLIVLVTLANGGARVSAAQGIQLDLVAESDLIRDFAWQWTADSQTFWFTVDRPNTTVDNSIIMAYSFADKTVKTITASPWPPVPLLSSDEINFFSPYLKTDYKGNRVPVAIFLPMPSM